jgi:hypothetical protein
MKEEIQIETAIKHNYQAGWNFVEELKLRRRGCPVLYPADLVPVHQHWEQAHFQALWLSIIAEKCTELHMSEGWQFSNGGSEELTHAVQLRLGLPRHKDLVFFNTKESEEIERERMRNIKIYDHLGNIITIADAVNAIEEALSYLGEHGFEPKTLKKCLRLLDWTRRMIDRGFYQ